MDWLLARDPGGETALIAFRLPARLDEIAPGRRIEAERIADHRPLYLEYEGPISGDRGAVTRLARGRIRSGATDGRAWDLSLEWEREGAAPTRQRVSVRPRDSERPDVAVVAVAKMVESPPIEGTGRTPRKET